MGTWIGSPYVAAVDEKTIVANAGIDHRVEQGERSADVVAVILARVLHRFADVRVGGEVNHGRHAMLTNDAIDERAIADLSFDQWTPTRRPAMSVDEVVEDNGLEARPRHGFGRLTSDVASPSDDQNRHDSLT
jgi:hypothetical protein